MMAGSGNAIAIGAPIPFFKARALSGNPTYAFDTVAGRAVIIAFLGSAGAAHSRAALQTLDRHRQLLDDINACFFGVTCDPADESEGRIAQQLPGIRFFLDYDQAISKLYGAIGESGGVATYHPHWIVLDRTLRLVGRYPIDQTEAAIAALRATIASQRDDSWAPVLQVDNVLEPDLCAGLIRYYEENGGEESGFMRDVGGQTVGMINHAHKRREDCTITDPSLIRALQQRVSLRVRPMILRAFQFDASRMERYIVACYDGASGGHFNAHRDNTTKGTAHRRFAVSINLNTGDYDGGGLAFPEYGPRIYHPSRGGAVVFSCSLLHRAMPVTRGKRYAFLPFLYDDAGAALRQQNEAFLSGTVERLS